MGEWSRVGSEADWLRMFGVEVYDFEEGKGRQECKWNDSSRTGVDGV